MSGNIHMHTIRHAYKELELLGLIEIRRPLGAIVTSNLSEVTLHDAEEIDSFIRSTVSEAKNRFNLSPEEIVSLIERGAGLTTLTEQPNWFIECNSSQINDHIAQISASWDANINPLLLSHEGLLPEGNIIFDIFSL